MGLYWAYFTIQDYESAIECARQAVRLAPDNPSFIRQLAVAYGMLGQEDNCKQAVADYLRLEPTATVGDVKNIPARNQQTLVRFVEAIRMIGVPES